MIQKLINIIIGIVIIFTISSCIATKPEKKIIRKIFPDVPENYLSESDLSSAKIKALEGDVEVAYKVAYYYLEKMDIMSGIGWMIFAANNGYVPAQYSLASVYGSVDRFKNSELEEYWLKKAATNGYGPAKTELEVRGKLPKQGGRTSHN